MHLQVLERIKDPLQTMISRDHFETAYAVLANFLLIVQRAPVIFSQVSRITFHAPLPIFIVLAGRKTGRFMVSGLLIGSKLSRGVSSPA